MRWIEITDVKLSPNPVACQAMLTMQVGIAELERFLTVGEVHTSKVGVLNGTRLDLFKFREE